MSGDHHMKKFPREKDVVVGEPAGGCESRAELNWMSRMAGGM